MSVHEESIEWPHFEQYSDTPMFNTKAVVQQTGIPAPTLRAWERRYSLLAPERADNAYRLYSQRDIALVRWLKERIDAGMSISQAIALYRHMGEERGRGTIQSEEPVSQGITPTVEHPPAFQVAITPPLPQSETLPVEDNEPHPLTFWPHLGEQPELMGYPAAHNMRLAREQLIDAFRNLDEPMAHMIMGSILSIYPVEKVCTQLIAPTLWQVGQLWADNHLLVPEEHFASNFFRALLTNLFHVTPGPINGPHALVCCAPGEPHELSALMLALFLRRRGLRVAYLGQSIETAGLIRTIKKIMPSLVCVSLTMPAYLPALITLGRQVQMMVPPRPIFAFGGQVFMQEQYTSIIQQIPGTYLDSDLCEAADKLHSMVLARAENKN